MLQYDKTEIEVIKNVEQTSLVDIFTSLRLREYLKDYH